MQKLFLSMVLLVAFCLVRGQELRYSDCPGCWNADSLGNHRVVVRFEGTGNVGRVVVPWRRRDLHPENKRIIVQDSATGKLIMHKRAGAINRESGEVFFEPVSGKGTYYIYYMPYRNEGRSNYPKGVYWKADTTNWPGAIGTINCKVAEMQSIDAFNSFYPMEVIAMAQETEALVSRNKGKAFLVFPEDRWHSIRMRHDLPYRWIKSGGGGSVAGEATRGEYFAFQLGVYALKDLEDVELHFTEPGKMKISCINTEGVSYTGQAFVKKVHVPKGEVQALWCGVDVPADALPGEYKCEVTIEAGGQEEVVPVRIKVGAGMGATRRRR